MKLSTIRIKQALDQFDIHTDVLPDDHPMADRLEEIFGEHTFFLDEDGLEIIEPAPGPDEGSLQEETGQVVRIAMWQDVAQTTLSVSPAKITGMILTFPRLAEHQVDLAGEDSFPASDATTHSGITGPD